MKTYCGAGGGGGSSWVIENVLAVPYLDGSGQNEGNFTQSNGAGRGGNRCANTPSSTRNREGGTGYVSVSWNIS